MQYLDIQVMFQVCTMYRGTKGGEGEKDLKREENPSQERAREILGRGEQSCENGSINHYVQSCSGPQGLIWKNSGVRIWEERLA